MNRRELLAASSGIVALSGCLETVGMRSGPDDDATAFDIGMSPNAFEPEEFSIDVGETVVWKNNASRAHTVTAYEGGIPEDAPFFATGDFDDELTAREEWEQTGAGNIYTGDRYEVEFYHPGEYRYFCVPHEPRGMIGRIIVEE